MITTIIFDLAEVYLHGIVGVQKQLKKFIEGSEEEIYSLLKGENFINLMQGKITEEEYFKNIIDKNNLEIKISQFKEIIRRNFKEIKGTRKIIEKLKGKGYKLGLLSVHAKEWIQFCEEKYCYHKLFHSKLYSFENSISKPDKKAYLEILNRLKSSPKECLFIDDSIKNILAAKELGIATIYFKNPKQLKKDLKKMKILPT